MKKIFKWVIFFCLITNIRGYAQNPLDGNWYSNGTVVIEGSTNSYLGELKMKQKGNTLTGQFNYYFRDSLFSTKINGAFDLNSRYVVINSFPLILHSSVSTKTGVDCSMTGEFMLRMSRMGSYLSGKFIADAKYKYTCPEITFNFEKNTNPISPMDEAKQATLASAETSTQKDTVVPIADLVASLIIKQFENRPKDIFKELVVESKVIDLEFVDNGAIDYDSISVFLNNKLILKETMLTHTPIKLRLTLDDSLPVNELSIFANNEGLIPPNTATLTLIDGYNKTEIDITSSLHSTATLKLLRRKK